MVLGPPRSGKTSSLIIPNVLSANGPVVTTSTKPDVLDATVAARSVPRAMPPVRPCRLGAPKRRADSAALVASAVVWHVAGRPRHGPVVGSGGFGRSSTGAGHGEGSHWTERAQALLAPLLHAAALDGCDMRTVLTWVDRHQALPAQQALAGGPGRASELARNLLDGIAATEARELSGIWSTASGCLAGFRSDQALRPPAEPTSTRQRSWNRATRSTSPRPAHHQALVAPMVVGLLEDVRRAAYAHHAKEAEAGSVPVRHPLLLALDEVANIAPLPDLPAMVSEGGGQGVITLACFQDLSQARQRWPGRADGFASLFGTTVVLPGIGDVATLDALSTLAGDEELVVRTVSAGRGRHRPPGHRLWPVGAHTAGRAPPHSGAVDSRPTSSPGA